MLRSKGLSFQRQSCQHPHKLLVPRQDMAMFSQQKKTNTHRASSDRQHRRSAQPGLESSAITTRGSAPLRQNEPDVISSSPAAGLIPADSDSRTRPTSAGRATNLNPTAAANTYPTEAHAVLNSVAMSDHVSPNAYPITGSGSDHHVPRLPPAVPDGSSMPNILIFGETGTGKSSLVNMLAGRNVAGVSSEALGCTFGSQIHEVAIDGKDVRLWDTAGLNEGEHGTVPAEQAMRNLQDLVHNLKGGISLLVYCIRGTRFRDIMQINYELFCSIICQNKVPVVIVVTGLENESPRMESWWEQNGAQLGDHGMNFAGHACVTTTRGKQMKSGGYMFEEEYEESEGKTRKLVMENLRTTRWVMDERTWLADITSKLVSYYDQQAYGGTESVENRQRSSPGSSSVHGATALLWKLTELLVRTFAFLLSAPQQPADQSHSGT